MSLTSLLSKIWTAIKSLWTDLPSELKYAVGLGVLIAQNLKTFVDSPAADILTAVIPGNLDEQLKLLLRAALPKILAELLLVQKTADFTDPQAIVAEGVRTLQALDPKISSAFLHNISILLAQVAADGKLSWSDGVYVLEYYYQNEFNTAQ